MPASQKRTAHVWVWMPEDQKNRIKRIAKQNGMTLSTFCNGAAVARANELEAEAHALEAARAASAAAKKGRRPAPSGLFVPPAPREVVPERVDPVDGFARYILSANSKTEREAREEEVLRKIVSASSSKQEIEAVVRALDARVQVLRRGGR